MTKIDKAFEALPKGKWVSRKVLVDKTGDGTLRSVRRLRDAGYEILVNDKLQYCRTND